MIEIRYVNSQGIEFNFSKNDHIKIKEADFHKSVVGVTTTQLKHSTAVMEFTKEPLQYETKLYITGTNEEKRRVIDELHDAAAYDREKNTPGKLHFGEWYIYAYIIEEDSYPNDSGCNTVKDIVFFCPEQYWVKEEVLEFYPQKELDPGNGLDFPTDFPFDFTQSDTGVEIKKVNHNIPSDAIIRIYGPCKNPKITINGYPYEVFNTVEPSEYMEIDTKKHTVFIYHGNGTKENIYNSRSFEHSVFEKIPANELVVNWIGTFGFDIVVLAERSIPRYGK